LSNICNIAHNKKTLIIIIIIIIIIVDRGRHVIFILS